MEFLKYLAVAIAAVFAPIKGIIITSGILIFADFIFGIIAAKKRGEKITSAAMRRTVSKALIYQSAILTLYLVEIYLLSSSLPVTKILAGVIGLVESTSLLENMQDITGIDLSKVIKMLGSKNDK